MNRSQSAGRCAVALSLLLALTAGCSSLTADAELRLEVFDTYADALARDYPFFPQKHVDWESLTHSYRSAVVAAEGPGEFYHLLVGLLAELDDAHVSLAIPAANWGGVGASTTTVLDLPGFEVAWLERRLHVTAWPDGQAPVTPEHLPPELGGFPQITKVQGARVTVPLVDEMFRGPAGSVVELQLAWADGTLTRHTLRRPSPRSRQRVEATGGVRRGTVVIGRSVGDDAMSRIASLEHRGRFAWLRLNSFVPPPGEDGDARFTAHVDALLTEAAERDGLVLD
ncbi:MAG: hypothetical protein KDE27_31200, partial [Planctomycetes bacterium]|nr:hypothetical protein [Planctomycetota bacterium]